MIILTDFLKAVIFEDMRRMMINLDRGGEILELNKTMLDELTKYKGGNIDNSLHATFERMHDHHIDTHFQETWKIHKKKLLIVSINYLNVHLKTIIYQK